MRVPGFEPGTSALSELRSSQLSYTRDVQPNPSSFAEVPDPTKKPTDSVGSPRRGGPKSYLSGGTIRRMVMGFSVGVAGGLLDNTGTVQDRQPGLRSPALLVRGMVEGRGSRGKLPAGIFFAPPFPLRGRIL